MNASLVCLLGLIVWTIVLLFVLVGTRAKLIVGGKLVFDQQGADLPGIGARITRAQSNSLEWLTIPAALLLYAIATNQTAVTDGLAIFVLSARVAQSIVHIAAITRLAVFARASIFSAQAIIWLIWTYGFYNAGMV